MLSPRKNTSFLIEIFRFFDLLYHSTVRSVRQSNVNPIMGLFRDILQAMLYVLFFILFMRVLGMREMAIRGNEILFIMSGVFLFLVHTKAIAAVMQTKGPLNKMNLHTHVTSILNILANALAGVYIQVISFFIILYFTHVLMEPVVVFNPAGVAFAFFVAWLTGIAIGNLFLSISIFYPKTMALVSKMFIRLNMVFSGKFMMANSVPGFKFYLFAWNPLFHTIDHARSAAFINYTARRTDIHYALWVAFTLLVISFMIDHWTRKYASVSWQARQ